MPARPFIATRLRRLSAVLMSAVGTCFPRFCAAIITSGLIALCTTLVSRRGGSVMAVVVRMLERSAMHLWLPPHGWERAPISASQRKKCQSGSARVCRVKYGRYGAKAYKCAVTAIFPAHFPHFPLSKVETLCTSSFESIRSSRVVRPGRERGQGRRRRRRGAQDKPRRRRSEATRRQRSRQSRRRRRREERRSATSISPGRRDGPSAGGGTTDGPTGTERRSRLRDAARQHYLW